jgi:hypothetical protein
MVKQSALQKKKLNRARCRVIIFFHNGCLLHLRLSLKIFLFDVPDPRFSRWVGGSLSLFFLIDVMKLRYTSFRKVESIRRFLTFPKSLSHINEAFEFLKFTLRLQLVLKAIFIFQGTKKSKF